MKMKVNTSILKAGFAALTVASMSVCEGGTLTVKFKSAMKVEIDGEVREFAVNDTFTPTAIPCIYRMCPVLAEGERTFTVYGNDNIRGERNCRFPLRGEGNWVRVALDPYPVEDKTVELTAVKATGVYYVDAANGNDEWDGTTDYENRIEEQNVGPKKSLQAANDAATGDFPIVLAAPGVYDSGTATNEANNARCIRRLITYKNIGFVATSGAGSTFIVGAPDSTTQGLGVDAVSGVYMHPLNSYPAFIQGFTITGCYSPYNGVNENAEQRGAAFSSSGNLAYCLDCVISNNYARLYPAVNYGIVKRTMILENQAYRKITNYGVFLSCIFAGNRITNGDNTENTRAYQDANIGYFCTYDLRNDREPSGRKKLDSSSSELHSCFVYGLTDETTYNENRWNDSLYSYEPQFANADDNDYRVGVRSLAQNASSYSEDLDGTARSLMTGDIDGRMPILHDGMMRIGAVWNEPGTWYVSQADGDDANDGKSSAYAKATVKAATDLAFSGDTIYVAPGIYAGAEGSQMVSGNVESRVVVPEDVALIGTAGAEETFIVGAAATGDQVDNETYGTGTNAVRCVYANNGAVVRGFTLTGGRGVGVGLKNDLHDNMMGAAFFSASPLGATIENCVVSNNAAAVGTIYNAVVRHCRVIGNFGVLNDASGAAGYGCNWYGSIIDRNYGNGTMCFPEVVEGCTIGSHNRNLADSDASQVLVWNTDEDKAIVNTAVLGGKFYFGGDGNLYCTNSYVIVGKYLDRVIPADQYSVRLCNTIVGTSGAVVDAAYRPIPDAVSLIDNGDAAYATESVGDVDVLGGQRIYNGKMDIGAVEYDWRPTFSGELGRRFAVTDASPSVVTNAAGGLVVSDGAVSGTVRSEGPYKVLIDMTGGTVEVYAGDDVLGEASGSGSHSIRFKVDDITKDVRIVYAPDEENPAPAVFKAFANARGFILGIR